MGVAKGSTAGHPVGPMKFSLPSRPGGGGDCRWARRRASHGAREGGQVLFSDHCLAEPFIRIKLGVGDTLGQDCILVIM